MRAAFWLGYFALVIATVVLVWGMDVMTVCWLAEHGVHESGHMPSCDGKLRKCHLIPRSLIRREVTDPELFELALWHEGVWVWACGGPTGIGGHHGMFDSARTLRVPRTALPTATELLAEKLGLGWWLDREYDPTLTRTHTIDTSGQLR